ncbi:MAG: arsenic metallochaperone ArsD family protein, partial [Deltaproteobacteria bacterium]|nr:arsenic metallochaperone ArsD family protein [Deltaproteobacteria bacterium]
NGKVKIECYLLSQQGPKFMQNPQILSLLKANGVSVLPVTAVNGKVVKQREYPSYEELLKFIGG